MVPVGVTKEEGQTVQYLDCPECGHQLKEPTGSVLVALRLAGAGRLGESARVDAKQRPQCGQLSSLGARRALVALQQCLGEIALVENESTHCRTRHAAFPNVRLCRVAAIEVRFA